MNNWLNRLERKYGRFGIPNLTNILVGGQILVLAIELFVNRTVMAWLALSRFFLLQGQVWRVVSFVFIPFSGGSILSVVLGIWMGMGAIGVWIAMDIDWVCRVICFVARYFSGAWTRKYQNYQA